MHIHLSQFKIFSIGTDCISPPIKMIPAESFNVHLSQLRIFSIETDCISRPIKQCNGRNHRTKALDPDREQGITFHEIFDKNIHPCLRKQLSLYLHHLAVSSTI